jgi:hypothetical protein
MRLNIKKSILTLLDISPARRNYTPYPDDICIVSYPKSGNTWVRFLLANYIQDNEEVGFTNIEQLVPDIYQSSNMVLMNAKRPRILKSHEVFDPKYRKIIYIYRDPRDVIISYYYFSIKIGKIKESYPIEEFFNQCVANGISNFGTWYDNVNSWLAADHKDIVYISYESLLSSTADEMKKIIDHIGYTVDDRRIEECIKRSSFDNMSKLEKVQSHIWKPMKGKNKKFKFVRKGTSGQWRELLGEACTDSMPEHWVGLMNKLEYHV